jgi:hypothetical protein
MAEKTTIFYQVRPQLNRVDGSQSLVPAIVDREDSVPLEDIIKSAIDRGLIVGLKPSAASNFARALGEQMYDTFKEGRGVKFGGYFSARLYLDGTTDEDGRLTEKNGINVRFTNGPLFKMDRSMFSFSNVEGGDIPGVDFAISEADGAVRGKLIVSAAILLNGVNLYKDGDAGTKVSFYLIDPETGAISATASAEVTEFISRGPNVLNFAWPQGLAAGSSYQVIPSRTADGERWFAGTGKSASVVQAE